MSFATSFWQTFFLLFLFIPMTVLWIVCVFDAVRRPDVSGWNRAAWVAAIIILPLLGPLVYLAVRGPSPESTGARDEALRMQGRMP
jgi:Phospholipase_D-nuclease N-terminal